MQDPTNLAVYSRALDFATECARIARRIRAGEAPGLAAQLSRAACSIPANISEGVGQPSFGVAARHLATAIGSACEAETHLRLAKRLSARVDAVEMLLDEGRQLRAMLYALRRHYLAKAERLRTTKGKDDE